MNVMFLVNGRWFKTLCKTVLEAEAFDVSISTEKHNILAHVSDKCYFTSIDNYCLGYDTIDTIKTDFFFSRNFKNTKEFLSKLDDTLTTFLNTSIRDKDFFGNLDECIEKSLQDIKKATEEPERQQRQRQKRKPITTDIDMVKDFAETAETEETTDPEVGKFVYDVRIHNDYGWDTYTVAGDDVESAVYKALKRVEYECGKEECSSIDVIRIYKEDSNELLKEIISKEREDPETATAKSLLNSAYGITAERETAERDTPVPNEPKTDHTYEIRIFKNGVFISSLTFSSESFAETAFSIIEENAIDFSKPCIKVIQLFKDGKPVKRSIINFGVKVNNQAGEKWQIINKNTLDSIMKVFKCVQGNCRERIVVDGEYLVEILADIYLHLMINDLLADKKPKKIHYDFRHMYPNNYISLPESTHFTIIYNRGFFYIDLNSIKRGFCPNRKTMNFFVEGEKNG